MAASRLPRLQGRPPIQQWTCLLGLSVAFVAVAEYWHIPAALLIGPMLAAILMGTQDATIRVSAAPFIAAQGVIGCMIGRSIPLSVLGDLAEHWSLFLFAIASVIAAASALGLLMSRSTALPGTTAIWGTSPGAATSMIIMSEAYGGDIRLVAVMQHLRVMCVVVTATLVARIWGGVSHGASPQTIWFPPLEWSSFLEMLAVAGLGSFAAVWLRIPAGAMLLPMVIAIALSETMGLSLMLPPWVLALSYALVGWNIGLRFTRPVLMHALRALPGILASIILLIAVCALIAAALVVGAGIDPLTAYLATSPGGLDSVAIIAAASHVDLRFVMAMQTTRLVVVLMISPGLARYLARRQNRGATP